jgi:uncharacterized membrane protein YciS (DUF1049 family)
MSNALNLTSEEIISLMLNTIANRFEWLIGLAKALGVFAFIYVIYLIFKSFMDLRMKKRIKRIERKLDTLDQKLDKLTRKKSRK